METTIPKRVFQYEIDEQIGEGKNGVVYLATDTSLDRTVALKVIRPEVSERPDFARHTRPGLPSLVKLDHPAIAGTYDIIEHDGQTVIVGEYVEGRPITDLFHGGPVDVESFLKAAQQIASALVYAHENALVHGNLQPTNIIVDDENHVKLVDFCLPRAPISDHSEADEEPELTLAYASPEEISGEKARPGSDMFSLGSVLFETLSLKAPFTGYTSHEIAQAVLYGKPEFDLLRRRNVSGDIVLLLESLLTKKRDERCSSAAQLAITLETMGHFEQTYNSVDSDRKRRIPPRAYLIISLLAIFLLIVWFFSTIFR